MKSQVILEREKKERKKKKQNLQNIKLKIDQSLLVPNEQLRPKFTFFSSEAIGVTAKARRLVGGGETEEYKRNDSEHWR